MLGLAGLLLGLIVWQGLRRSAVVVAVGVDLPLVPGAAINPSDRHTADLYLEEHPRSRLRLVNHFNDEVAASGPASIAKLKRQGVRFFITTQSSTLAVPSLREFADGSALAINVSAVSNRLSGHDDFFFRVVPDVTQEQQAIARRLDGLPGRRLLVLQDISNPGYTEPAFAVLQAELSRSGRWQMVKHRLSVPDFDPRRDQHLLTGRYDAVYLLAGTFLPMIGNVAQLLYTQHPNVPILLTPWANSPAILESAGPAVRSIQIASNFRTREQDLRIDRYLRRFERRFGYTPYAMALRTRQAFEILDAAVRSGATTPMEVKRYLLRQPQHSTSFGVVRFDADGDVAGAYQFLKPRWQTLP